MKTLLAMTVAATLAASPAMAFNAEDSCAETGAILTSLSDRFSETVIFAGVDSDNTTVVSLHLSPSGSWSLVASGNGVSCLAAFGEGGQVKN